MSSNSSAILRPSWDIPGTTFQSFELLSRLFEASSKDNVHPQAILCAEAVGAGLLVAPKRISEAIESLGGNDSVKLESIKATVGLSSGGTQKTVRQSTPLLQFYIFCTACKLIFLDDEIGNLIFEITTVTGLLAKHPVAPTQMSKLISYLAGHAEQIVPVEEMHEIAVRLAPHCPSNDVYMRVDSKALSQLFVQVFENLRDESVESMSLSGHDSAVWVSTALTWMLGDEACLIIDSELVIGNLDAKLTVTIEPYSSEPWKLHVWKRSLEPAQYVFEFDRDENHILGRLPIRNVCSFFVFYYRDRDMRQDDLSRECKRVAGELAAALILLLAEDGRPILERECCAIGETPCSQTDLMKVASLQRIAEYNGLITNYGWEPIPIQTALKSRMKEYLAEILDVKDMEKTATTTLNRDAQTILKDFCATYVKEEFGDTAPSISIDDLVIFVAADAILTATVRIKTGKRYISPMDRASLHRSANVITALLTTGMDVRDFRTCALQQILPGMPRPSYSSLILSSNGYVAGMSVLWKPTTTQRESLEITVLRGQIRKDNITYSGIRESVSSSMQRASLNDCQPLRFGEDSTFSQNEMVVQPSLAKRAVHFETFLSVSGDWLEIKNYMILEDGSLTSPKDKYKVSWVESIDVLATSHHIIDPRYFTSAAEQEISTRIQDKLSKQEISLTNPRGTLFLSNDACIVIDCPGGELTKLFVAGHCGREALCSPCRKIVIQHQGSLLQSIEQAEDQSSTWILLY